MRANPVAPWSRLLRAGLGLALLAALPRVAAGDPPADELTSASADVAIATIEHRRTGVAGLDPILAEGGRPATRRRAITALGRIGGDDDAVGPRLRALLLRAAEPELETALWAAGVSGRRELLTAVLAHVEVGEVPVRVAAIDAAGMLGNGGADAFLIPCLADDAPAVRTAAGYALARTGSEHALEAVVARVTEKDPGARRAAAAAAWRCAGARKKARGKAWDGDPGAASALKPLTADGDPETRLFALRALMSLWPKTLDGPAERRDVGEAVADADPRVVADVLFRLTAAGHDGASVVDAVAIGLANADPLVRETAAETAAKVGGDKVARVLATRLAREPDARVRERIAVALAACGDDEAALKALARSDRPADVATRAATEGRALLASKKQEAHAQAVARLRDPRTPVLALEALLEGFADVDDPGLEGALKGLLAHPDSVVRGSAASLIGDKKMTVLAPDLETLAASRPGPGAADAERDARQGALEALLALDQARLDEMKNDIERQAHALARAARWVEMLRAEPSASVRRDLLDKFAASPHWKTVPLLKADRFADLPRNDWRGLPRPPRPILGLDLSGGTGFLSELEVLRLAARIAERKPLLEVATAGLGVTTYRLDADAAPVHAASTVIAAVSGVYDGTPWHRVVPAFVIQGADPRGDGSGDAGWLLPDEITRRPFLRGALGMPKGVKDTGGCQLFAMHLYAPHLDGRYAAFGEAVSGLDVIDRIRVGDRILSVRLVEPTSPK